MSEPINYTRVVDGIDACVQGGVTDRLGVDPDPQGKCPCCRKPLANIFIDGRCGPKQGRRCGSYVQQCAECDYEFIVYENQ